RALGQRSILGHPGRRELVAELNSQIKNRDFWMPFAPSNLENEAARYIENPKALPAPHMMLTFDSTERGRAELAAAIHPADATTSTKAASLSQPSTSASLCRDAYSGARASNQVSSSSPRVRGFSARRPHSPRGCSQRGLRSRR